MAQYLFSLYISLKQSWSELLKAIIGDLFSLSEQTAENKALIDNWLKLCFIDRKCLEVLIKIFTEVL